MGAFAIAAGLALGAGGTALSANAASKKRGELGATMDKWLPNIDDATSRYFEDLLGRTGQADKLADTVGEQDLDRTLRLREKAAPGIGKLTGTAIDSILPLLRGELPQGVLESFARAGGASSVGSGFGGSGYGFLNTGLFGARGSLGAMQTGFGLLPALMSTLPNINSPSTAAFLQGIMTPAQRVSTQMQIRQQNLGIASQVAGMPTSGEVWGNFLGETGGALLGGAMGGMGGGGGMAPIGGTGMSTGYGPSGTWQTPTTPSYGGMTGANRLFG